MIARITSGGLKPAGRVLAVAVIFATEILAQQIPVFRSSADSVTVNASVPSDPKDEYSEPKLLHDKAYTEPATTSLSFEVKEGAGSGAYDLKLKN